MEPPYPKAVYLILSNAEINRVTNLLSSLAGGAFQEHLFCDTLCRSSRTFLVRIQQSSPWVVRHVEMVQ